VSDVFGTQGDESLPELAVTPQLMDAVMYAAAMWEFQRLHFDEAWARHEGLPGPIVQGPLLGNYLARAVTQGAPVDARLERLAWRNRAVVQVGVPLRIGGALGPPDLEGRRAAELWIVDGSGSSVVTGSAQLGPVQP
jgi:hydroxyacyl-ACP dehydratase HTD2-like protein with hotdog domain